MKFDLTGQRIEFDNGLLTVSLSLSPEPGPLVQNRAEDWYAGAANSVRFAHREWLDLFRHYLSKWNWTGHDKEKRCFQIARIRVSRVGAADERPLEADVFNRQYQHVGPFSTNGRKLRFTIAAPITLGEGSTELNCALVRTFATEEGANYIIEDVTVRELAGSDPLEIGDERLEFSLSYFGYMDLGRTPTIRPVSPSPHYFAIGWVGDHALAPKPAYGFATTGVISAPLCSDAGYPLTQFAYKTHVWGTAPCLQLRNAHVFMEAVSAEAIEEGMRDAWQGLTTWVD